MAGTPLPACPTAQRPQLKGPQQAVPAIAISTEELCDRCKSPACEAANAAHYAEVADYVVDFIAHLETKPGFLAKTDGMLPGGLA